MRPADCFVQTAVNRLSENLTQPSLPFSRSAVQPFSRSAVQPFSRSAVHKHSKIKAFSLRPRFAQLFWLFFIQKQLLSRRKYLHFPSHLLMGFPSPLINQDFRDWNKTCVSFIKITEQLQTLVESAEATALNVGIFMKFKTISRSLAIVILVGFLSACGGGGGGGGGNGSAVGVSGATSSLCLGITGATAIMWDVYNGIPRTDDGLPPPIPTGGGPFTHTVTPMLGFVYPGSYVASQIPGNQNVIGVDVIRSDQQAGWRYLQQLSLANPFSSATQVRDQEVSQWLTFLGLQNTQQNTICSNDASGNLGGMPGTISSVMLQVGTHTILVTSTMTPLGALGCAGCAQLFSNVAVAPTSEFEALAYNTFLAMSWQLLRANPNSLSDRDGDGVPDIYDSAPDDPSQQ